MRNQMSFGKRDRQDRPLNANGNSIVGGGLDDSGFRSELMMRDANMLMMMQDGGGGTHQGEEFSDESLFGEDNIEKLIEKKNSSFLRGSN